MDSQSLTVRYDPTADELSLDLVPRYPAQVSDEIQPGVIIRSNPETGIVENIDILDFILRTQRQGLSLAINARFGTLEQVLAAVV